MKILMPLTTSRYLNEHLPTLLQVITDVVFAESGTFTDRAGKELKQCLLVLAMGGAIINTWRRCLV